MFGIGNNKNTFVLDRDTVFVIPAFANAIHCIVFGAGGGGGGGVSVSGNTAARGGNGGGTGAMKSFFCPVSLMPRDLIITLGVGGAGGTVGNAGSTGGTTKIEARWSNSDYQPYDFFVYATGGGGGAAGASGTGFAAHASGGQISAANAWQSIVSITQFAGNSGGVSVGGQTYVEATAPMYVANSGTFNSNFLCGGAAGAGNDAGTTYISGGDARNGMYIARGGNNGAQGDDGIINFAPLIFTGGGGGQNGSLNRDATAGGSGAFGCGGGGGGSANNSRTAGAGGRGGDGLVIITLF